MRSRCFDIGLLAFLLLATSHVQAQVSAQENASMNITLAILPTGSLDSGGGFGTPTWDSSENLMAASYGLGFIVMDARTGQTLTTVGTGRYPSISPDGTKVASIAVSQDRSLTVAGVEVWDRRSGQRLGMGTAPELGGYTWYSIKEGATWSPDSNRFAASVCGSASGAVYIWEATSLNLLRTLNFTKCVVSARWSPSGLSIAALDTDYTIHIIDAARGLVVKEILSQTTKKIDPTLSGVQWMVWNGNGTQIAVRLFGINERYGIGDNIAVFDVMDGNQIRNFKPSFGGNQFSWNGESDLWIAVGSVQEGVTQFTTTSRGFIQVFDSAGGQLLATTPIPNFDSPGILYLSPKGTRLVFEIPKVERIGSGAIGRGTEVRFYEIQAFRPAPPPFIPTPSPTSAPSSTPPLPSPVRTAESTSTSGVRGYWAPIAVFVAAVLLGFIRARRPRWLERKVRELETRKVDVADIRRAMEGPGKGAEAARQVKEKFRLLAEEVRLQERIRVVESRKREITAKLAEGKLSEAAFGAENRRLEAERAELREKLAALHEGLYKEEYEKPVF